MKLNATSAILILATLTSSLSVAAETAAGIGLDNQGANLKLQYEASSTSSLTKGIVELKGIAGDSLGWSGTEQRDNSIDSVRARLFSNSKTSGLGFYMDANYDVERESADLSANMSWHYQYQKLEVLPYVGMGLTLVNGQLPLEEYGYPIDDHVTGYTLPGSYGQVGAYLSYHLLDNLTFTYNPEYRATLGGAASYVNAYYEGDSSQFHNEVRLSYAINKQWDVQYHSEWYAGDKSSDVVQGLEFNYHF
ncbi:hypothetical protein L1D34_21570 [Vibrio mediterranei]|uniref:oligogalacturonate-specific porin KdgM family protein n=1 Tax=Vibrio mediterranei TaxID=689 RepID=UPI001EFEAD9E|nr:oligogalacturonate-specific porin KdgM family protein [Vibrio mediterranei]MCG9627426.1 hypothetical protein [Vibrio mediterranei]